MLIITRLLDFLFPKSPPPYSGSMDDMLKEIIKLEGYKGQAAEEQFKWRSQRMHNEQ